MSIRAPSDTRDIYIPLLHTFYCRFTSLFVLFDSSILHSLIPNAHFQFFCCVSLTLNFTHTQDVIITQATICFYLNSVPEEACTNPSLMFSYFHHLFVFMFCSFNTQTDDFLCLPSTRIETPTCRLRQLTNTQIKFICGRLFLSLLLTTWAAGWNVEFTERESSNGKHQNPSSKRCCYTNSILNHLLNGQTSSFLSQWWKLYFIMDCWRWHLRLSEIVIDIFHHFLAVYRPNN